MSPMAQSRLYVRIARIFIPLMVIAYGLACLLSFTLSDRLFFERFRKTLGSYASLIAVDIDGDAFKTIRGEEDPAYRKIKETLVRHRAAVPSIRDAYTMRPAQGTLWHFVVDAEPSGSELYSPPGEPYDTQQDPAIPEGLRGTSSSHTLTVDRWGTWLSGYAPIRTKGGEIVGVVGLDLSAAQYLRERSMLVRVAFGIFFLGILLASGFGFWFARRIARTEEAIQSELQDARDQALEAAKLKSSFLSTVSHEIRTPMHAILSMNTLLLDSPLEEEPRHFAEIMLDSTKSLLSIIDDVLDSSKIEAGKMHLESIPFSPLELVEAVAELFAPKALEKGLTLQAFVAPDLPAQLEGDPSRIRQVLLNLVSNAIKFTQTGGIL
ncbi:MAG: histidine kinase dimerization/phospho-acceptor domain-containing protein, partial [Bacteroidota bacterium]